MINSLFVEYEGKEKEFLDKFGFPMYNINEEGDIDFNYEYLILDFFSYIHVRCEGYTIQEIYGEDKIKIRNHNPYDKDNTLIFNNRNGALYDYNEIYNTKNCNPNFDKLCYYPFYEIMIDSDGKYRFCAHDWNRKIDFLKDVFNCSIEDFFINDMDIIRRNIVTNNKRMENLCGQCDANGRLHGENNFIIFKKEGIKNG